MIIRTDGSYYIMACEKCGTEIRKHKSYCTRYGEAFHFNPELKCHHCGFSAKIVYNSISTSSPLVKTGNESKREDNIQSSKPIVVGNPNYSDKETNAGVGFSEGTKTMAFMNKKEVNTEKGTANCPVFTPKHIDSKVEIINTLNTVLEELTEEKKIDEATKIMLFANFGMIEGTLWHGNNNGGIQRVSGASNKIRNIYLSKLEGGLANSIPSHNNDFITVFDAKIIPFSNPNHIVTMEVLNLFPDQIVGFTFGEYQ